MRKLNGFTIAGLLMTLLVMGFIFVLAIPIVKVSNKAKEKEVNINVKLVDKKILVMKAFSDLNQALLNIKTDKNCQTLSCTKLFEPGQSKAFADLLIQQVGTIKNCNSGTNSDCFAKKVTFPPEEQEIDFNQLANTQSFITKKGFSLLIHNKENYCKDKLSGYNHCGDIYIDVNGTQRPNTFGKDIFTYHILDFEIESINLNSLPKTDGVEPFDDATLDNISEADLEKLIELALKQFKN